MSKKPEANIYNEFPTGLFTWQADCHDNQIRNTEECELFFDMG